MSRVDTFNVTRFNHILYNFSRDRRTPHYNFSTTTELGWLCKLYDMISRQISQLMAFELWIDDLTSILQVIRAMLYVVQCYDGLDHFPSWSSFLCVWGIQFISLPAGNNRLFWDGSFGASVSVLLYTYPMFIKYIHGVMWYWCVFEWWAISFFILFRECLSSWIAGGSIFTSILGSRLTAMNFVLIGSFFLP